MRQIINSLQSTPIQSNPIQTPGRIVSKFCLVIGTQDAITCIEFGDDRLTGLGLAGC